jgi:hypothetical protein
MFFSATPFQADVTAKIFQNIIASEKTLRIPSALSNNYAGIIRGLLRPNPFFRLGNLNGGLTDIMNDVFFSTISWEAIRSREAVAPYRPVIKSDADSSNFNHYEETDKIPVFLGKQEIFDAF